MNMFKAVDASDIDGYIASLPDERQKVIRTIHNFIIDTVPSLKPWFANNMLGYGAFDYVNYKKEHIQWPIIALASQKNYMSIYVCAIGDNGVYIAEEYTNELYADGVKPHVGKSCIRFKKIEDLNLVTLKKVLLLAERLPGLESAAMKQAKSEK